MFMAVDLCADKQASGASNMITDHCNEDARSSDMAIQVAFEEVQIKI